ncbi:MAG: LysM peptidoglycan-binding domain-containing protein [Candidatus Hydrogenedentes bacterium]|nr:LysM peptidoglycan-binding domain-containing protein [Candidatus Hydrogenedentota bacterium]
MRRLDRAQRRGKKQQAKEQKVLGLNKGHHSASTTLTITFLLGIGIGIALAYVFFDYLKINFDDAAVQTTQAVAPARVEAPETETPGTEVPPPVAELAQAPADEAVEAAPAGDDAMAQPAPLPPAGWWPGLHLIVTVGGTELSAEEQVILAELRPGGVLLEAQNIVDEAQTRKLVHAIKAAGGMGAGLSNFPLIAVAQEGGPLFNPLQLSDAPEPAALAAGTDPMRMIETAKRYADAALAREIGVILGPSLDIYEPGLSDVVFKSQSFGSNQDVVAQLGIAFAENLSDRGVIPVVKHFPGLGAAAPGMEGFPTLQVKEVGDMAKLIYPFSEAALRKLPGMVIGQVAVPIMNPDRPYLSAVFSAKLLDIVRTAWEYDGVLIAGNMYDALQSRKLPISELVLEALSLGTDAVILKSWKAEELRAVVAALEAPGSTSPELQEASYRRFAAWQARLKVAEQAPATPRTEEPAQAPQTAPIESKDVAAEKATAPATPAPEPAVSVVVPAPDAVPPAAEPVPEAETKAPETVEAPKTEKAPEAAPVESAPAETTPAPPAEVPAAEVPPANDEAPTTGESPMPKAPAAIVSEPKPVPQPAAPETAPAAQTEAAPAVPPSAVENAAPPAESAAPAPSTAAPMVVETKSLPDATAEPAPKPEDVPADTVATPEPAPEIPPAPEVPTEPVGATEEAPAIEAPETPEPEAAPVPVVPDPSTPTLKREHKVVKGDTLGNIAKQYGVSVEDLKAWNGRQADMVKADETLLIYLPVAMEEAPAEELLEAPAAAPVEATPEEPEAPMESYVVAPGDNLNRIAKKFGVTQKQLMEANGITDPDKVKLGQKLKIPKP